MPRPFLKWAGGKQWLAERLAATLPLTPTSRYFEPFLGGGAVFFTSSPAQATLADSNEELIAAYRGVRDDVEGVIKLLSTFPYERSFFKGLRSWDPTTDAERAARLIYLNKTAFNGLYRVNRDGEFNVPFGRFVNPGICQPERLRMASTALRAAILLCEDFERSVEGAKAGDVVYFDPPYITSHTNNGFLKYNSHLFCWEDQLRLARLAVDLAKQGVVIIVSNAAYEPVALRYPGFHVSLVYRRTPIAGSVDRRRDVGEFIITSAPLEI